MSQAARWQSEGMADVSTTRVVSLERWEAGPTVGRGVTDTVIVEEPLEIRVYGQALAVLMRTPGDDRALVAGFLRTEGVVLDASDLRALEPCRDPNNPERANVYLVTLGPGCEGALASLEGARRTLTTTASCGLCGKSTIESIHQRVPPHDHAASVSARLLSDCAARARAQQPLFEDTGGSHGAAAFGPGPDHPLLAHAEDVGRHNAVDKVVGRLLLAELSGDLRGSTLWVSGRASFEMAQKALVAGFGALVCVGAPTSLAVDFAVDSRLTLVGFASDGGRFNVYAGSVRPD